LQTSVTTGTDLSDLAALLKTNRKRPRKAQIESEKVRPEPRIPIAAATDASLRFADYFKPLTEYKAPDQADIELFRNAVADAVELDKKVHRADLNRTKPKPIARHHNADELAALEASQLAMYPSPMSWDIGADIEDEQSFMRGALSPDLLRKLRRGHWTVDAEVDLHHHTQDEAHVALMAFMRKARTQGWRCVRIIHGKGLSSHQKIPILRSKVRRWLQQKDEVLAYCEPRPNGGGSGAVLVLLRGPR
jgi:DNA-nicking Smr family endonuclease